MEEAKKLFDEIYSIVARLKNLADEYEELANGKYANNGLYQEHLQDDELLLRELADIIEQAADDHYFTD